MKEIQWDPSLQVTRWWRGTSAHGLHPDKKEVVSRATMVSLGKPGAALASRFVSLPLEHLWCDLQGIDVKVDRYTP